MTFKKNSRNTWFSLAFLLVGTSLILAQDPPPAEPPAEQNQAEALQSSSIRVGGGVKGTDEFLQKRNSGLLMNEFTGQVAFTVDLGGISNHHGLQYDLNLSYFGGAVESIVKTHAKYSTNSWVGLGFSLGKPNISIEGGTDATESNFFHVSQQKYSISLDGSSTSELVPLIEFDNSGQIDNIYTLKNNPYIKVIRHLKLFTNLSLDDPCKKYYYPESSVAFTSNETQVDYWEVIFQNGIKYIFGEPEVQCSGSNYEMCLPIVNQRIQYPLFYKNMNGKPLPSTPRVFFLQNISDRQEKFALWFDYDKIQGPSFSSCVYMDNVHINAHQDAYPLNLERAVYLKEIFATNGASKTNKKTSAIIFHHINKTAYDESIYDATIENPLAYSEKDKLVKIEFQENGKKINEINFSYNANGGNGEQKRMILSSIDQTEQKFNRTRSISKFEYDNIGNGRLDRFTDSQGRIVNFKSEIIETAPLNTTQPITEPGYQDLLAGELIKFDQIMFTREVGNKYYVGIENHTPNGTVLANTNTEGQGYYTTDYTCSLHNGYPLDNGPETPRSLIIKKSMVERVYEFENIGTHWKLKRTIWAPTKSCWNYSRFQVSPDAKYYLWEYPVYNSVNNSAPWEEFGVQRFDSETSTLLFSERLSFGSSGFFLFPEWFAFLDPNNTLRFFVYDSKIGNFKVTCPALNYSGVIEPIDACKPFPAGVLVQPGNDFLAVVNPSAGSLHVIAYNGGLKDYTSGLESSMPPKGDFSSAEYPPGGAGIRPLYHDENYWNRSTPRKFKLSVSGDIIALISTMKPILAGGGENLAKYWKYLLVVGWDGLKMRYLHDEVILCNWGEISNGVDQYDPRVLNLVIGPDYFVLKNYYKYSVDDRRADPQCNSTGKFLCEDKNGIWFYKIDREAWTVKPRILLNYGLQGPTQTNPNSSGGEDVVIKPFQDYLCIERMHPGKGGQSYIPAQAKLTRSVATDGQVTKTWGDHYKFLNSHQNEMSRIYDVKGDTPRDLSNQLGGPEFQVGNANIQGDRILGVELPAYNFGIFLYKYITRLPDVNNALKFKVDYFQLFGKYFSARLVTGGILVSTEFNSTLAPENIGSFRFYPAPFSGRWEDCYMPGTPFIDYKSDALKVRVVTKIEALTKGPNSVGNDAQSVSFEYPTTSPDGAITYRSKNFASGLPEFKYVKKVFPQGSQFTEYRRNEINAQLSESEKQLNGMPIKTWVLPNNTSYKVPGGQVSASQMLGKASIQSPKVFVTQKIKDVSQSYFKNAFKSNVGYRTDYDSRNGQPKISVSKVGTDYLVNLTIFEHDLNPLAVRSDIVRQTATFKFTENPCISTGPDAPCPNLNLAFFNSSIYNMKKAIASNILVQDGDGLPKSTFVWKPAVLGMDYPLLDGNPVSGPGHIWQRQSDILNRQSGNPVAGCKNDAPTETEQLGIFSSIYYGGDNCNPIGSVSNSRISTSAVLTGEEEILATACANGANNCLGSFGNWEKGNAELQSAIVHTGRFAVMTTQQYGPTINLRLGEQPEFMNRKKGLMLSAWIYATANSNPSFTVEFHKVALADHFMDLVTDYVTRNGSFPIGKWVKVEKMITYAELVANNMFNSLPSQDYLRIWLGKGIATTANPVYVDDIRIYPADAQVTTQNYDETGLVTSELDGTNEPIFFEYDVWRNRTGARKKNGMVMSSSAVKLLNE